MEILGLFGNVAHPSYRLQLQLCEPNCNCSSQLYPDNINTTISNINRDHLEEK